MEGPRCSGSSESHAVAFARTAATTSPVLRPKHSARSAAAPAREASNRYACACECGRDRVGARAWRSRRSCLSAQISSRRSDRLSGVFAPLHHSPQTSRPSRAAPSSWHTLTSCWATRRCHGRRRRNADGSRVIRGMLHRAWCGTAACSSLCGTSGFPRLLGQGSLNVATRDEAALRSRAKLAAMTSRVFRSKRSARSAAILAREASIRYASACECCRDRVGASVWRCSRPF
jgi:hypothetical protein